MSGFYTGQKIVRVYGPRASGRTTMAAAMLMDKDHNGAFIGRTQADADRVAGWLRTLQPRRDGEHVAPYGRNRDAFPHTHSVQLLNRRGHGYHYDLIVLDAGARNADVEMFVATHMLTRDGTMIVVDDVATVPRFKPAWRVALAWRRFKNGLKVIFADPAKLIAYAGIAAIFIVFFLAALAGCGVL